MTFPTGISPFNRQNTITLVASLRQALQLAQRAEVEGTGVPVDLVRSANIVLQALIQGHPEGHDPRSFAEFAQEDWKASVADEFALSPRRVIPILQAAADEIQRHGIFAAIGNQPIVTLPMNSIPAARERPYPGDIKLETKILQACRWNAAMMVDGANERFPGIGGHIGTYASSAHILHVFLHHFFRGKNYPGGGDHFLIQGHDSPGIYAFNYLAGELTEDQLLRFRREAGVHDPETNAILIDAGQNKGLSSYPHPYLMPEKWEFHSVSMGLAQQLSIHQARVNRWLQAQGLRDTSSTRVWAIFGDGSMEEPEAQTDLHLAATEKLPVKFMINCNLQRLDGPVRGNGSVMNEFESRYRGAGWKVIKVITGSRWDELLARDIQGLIAKRMSEIPDGEFQAFCVKDGAYLREFFFGKKGAPELDEKGRRVYTQENPELLKLVEEMSDEALKSLDWGGHDFSKIYNAMKEAEETEGLWSFSFGRSKVRAWVRMKRVCRFTA
jgi:pyruvate dehydrogenase E1 component